MNRTIYILYSIFTVFVLTNSFSHAERIYKWVDNQGVRNFSNLPTNVPDNFFGKQNKMDNQKGNINLYKEDVSSSQEAQDQKDYFVRLKRQRELRDLLAQIRAIIDKEESLKIELIQKQDNALKTKREFDKSIISGYFADRSILELKIIHNEMGEIREELKLLKPKKKELIAKARENRLSVKKL